MQSEISDILLYNKKTLFNLSSYATKLPDLCAEALDKGYNIIEFNPLNSDKESVNYGLKIRQLCSIYDSLYLVKSRADIAKLTYANGITLKVDDITIENARKILNEDTIIGTYYINTKADFILSENHIEKVKYLFIRKNNVSYELTEYRG